MFLRTVVNSFRQMTENDMHPASLTRARWEVGLTFQDRTGVPTINEHSLSRSGFMFWNMFSLQLLNVRSTHFFLNLIFPQKILYWRSFCLVTLHSPGSFSPSAVLGPTLHGRASPMAEPPLVSLAAGASFRFHRSDGALTSVCDGCPCFAQDSEESWKLCQLPALQLASAYGSAVCCSLGGVAVA